MASLSLPLETIPPTRKIYDEDAYRRTSDGVVLGCFPVSLPTKAGGGDGYAVLLDLTVFFPEEGGQSCDTGTLGGKKVLYVGLCGKHIVHYLAEPFAVGDKVQAVIEYRPRFRKMQNHTAEHIISGIIHKKYGFDNVGFHLGDDEVTMDYNGVLTREQLNGIEDMANEAVWRTLPVITGYPSADVLAHTEYRSKLELTENVRIVSIPGYDTCACCAPHVRNTGEIGLIKITGCIRYKGGVRLWLKAGSDALADYREKYTGVTSIGALLSAKQAEVPAAVERLNDENEQLHKSLNSLSARLAAALAETIPDTDGNIVLFENELSAGGLRQLCNLLVKKCAACAVFRKEKEGYSFLIASEKESAKAIYSSFAASLPARGGGSDAMVQGSTSASEPDIRSFFRK